MFNLNTDVTYIDQNGSVHHTIITDINDSQVSIVVDDTVIRFDELSGYSIDNNGELFEGIRYLTSQIQVGKLIERFTEYNSYTEVNKSLLWFYSVMAAEDLIECSLREIADIILDGIPQPTLATLTTYLSCWYDQFDTPEEAEEWILSKLSNVFNTEFSLTK